MSNDTTECGCEGHVENFGDCKYPTLKAENERLRAALDVLERCAKKALDGVVDCLNECDLNLANEACAKARELTRE